MDQPRVRFGDEIMGAVLRYCCGTGLNMVDARAFAQSHHDIDERCQRRIEHAEHELHEAIERHGRDRKEADHERRELREAREQCWRENHRWWNEHEQRWHDERDWDDHDHDRD